MKSFNKINYTTFLIIFLISINRINSSDFIKTSFLRQKEDTLVKDKKEEKEIFKLNEQLKSLQEENENLKKEIENKERNDEINQNKENKESSAQIETYKDIQNLAIQINKFHEVFEQIKFQMERHKELRKTFNEKMKEISDSETRVKEVYSNIQIKYKNQLDKLLNEIEYLTSSNYDVNLRLFHLEKEIEIEKNKIKLGVINNLNIKKTSEEFLKKENQENCLNRMSCNVCLEDPKCVWCPLQRSCVNGGPSGPFDGSCSNSFNYSKC